MANNTCEWVLMEAAISRTNGWNPLSIESDLPVKVHRERGTCYRISGFVTLVNVTKTCPAFSQNTICSYYDAPCPYNGNTIECQKCEESQDNEADV